MAVEQHVTMLAGVVDENREAVAGAGRRGTSRRGQALQLGTGGDARRQCVRRRRQRLSAEFDEIILCDAVFDGGAQFDPADVRFVETRLLLAVGEAGRHRLERDCGAGGRVLFGRIGGTRESRDQGECGNEPYECRQVPHLVLRKAADAMAHQRSMKAAALFRQDGVCSALGMKAARWHNTPVAPKGFRMPFLRFLVLAVALLLPLAAARAAPVDVALVLAVDVSASIDAEEYELQHEGIARAFENPRVVEAIRTGAHGAIDALVMEWSDRDKQVVTVDWRRITDAATAASFAAAVRATKRSSNGLTAIGDALLAAAAALKRLPDDAVRRIIDVSGDGMANIGPPPQQIRDQLVASGISINGLAILKTEPWLDQYYDGYVVGGERSFLLQVDDFQSFATAMQQKLLNEIAARPQRRRAAFLQMQ
jgi:hypothetical protein